MGLWIQPSYNILADIDEDNLNQVEENIEKIEVMAEKYQIKISIENDNDDQNTVLVLIDKSQNTDSIGIFSGDIFNLPLFKENKMFILRTEKFLKEIGEVYPFIKEFSFTEPGVRIFVSS